jgi:hypothetical protein
VLFNIHTAVYSVTTHQYTVNNTEFWLRVLVLPKHLQANIYYMKAHSMCAYIIGSYSIYTNETGMILAFISVNAMGCHNVRTH